MTDSFSPALVLLPGSLCDERLFGPQVEHFSTSYEVIVADFSELDSIEAMALSVLNTAPASFVLAGLSMGGLVALQIMATAPERVISLALLDANAWVGSENDLRLRQAQIADVQARGEPSMLELMDTIYPRNVAAQNLDNEKLRALVIDMALKGGFETFIRHWSAIYARGDLGYVLSRIYCPTLVLCGAEDKACPPAVQRRMVEEIPCAELNIVPNCGHMSTLEAAREVNTALETLMTAASQQTTSTLSAQSS